MRASCLVPNESSLLSYSPSMSSSTPSSPPSPPAPLGTDADITVPAPTPSGRAGRAVAAHAHGHAAASVEGSHHIEPPVAVEGAALERHTILAFARPHEPTEVLPARAPLCPERVCLLPMGPHAMLPRASCAAARSRPLGPRRLNPSWGLCGARPPLLVVRLSRTVSRTFHVNIARASRLLILPTHIPAPLGARLCWSPVAVLAPL